MIISLLVGNPSDFAAIMKTAIYRLAAVLKLKALASGQREDLPPLRCGSWRDLLFCGFEYHSALEGSYRGIR